ncbi:hypothetical protein SARC_07245 [Sphaeroforma arctica JP610]|uniref:Sodium/nucleoside cotransporter n=1 Tax=Sphaeroforma arctica JP610 TaxID=667725 RepID=A0A0L0FWQ4_9EUKA|nr:hypothetical protein SARC_07245 [Sphaeroforma arctica JP610]KNC80388.1 hypothetical protein SARC_07245 [Sphaeroforma arctica JP610]|eukprot:XP_014154290.1 hypothetical protein SARC_07245 [Sphaeroforma arctica JP610]
MTTGESSSVHVQMEKPEKTVDAIDFPSDTDDVLVLQRSDSIIDGNSDSNGHSKTRVPDNSPSGEKAPRRGLVDVVSTRLADRRLKLAVGAVFLVGWIVYLGFAAAMNFSECLPLLVITGLILGYQVFFRILWPRVSDEAKASMKKTMSTDRLNDRQKMMARFALLGIAAGLIILFIVLEQVWNEPLRFLSLGGLFVYLGLCWAISKYPTRVNWHLVMVGMLLQFGLGYIVLQTAWGTAAFTWLSDLIVTFLGYSGAGSAFLFGDGYFEHFFAFSVLPTVCYFSAFVSVMYHFGIIQWMISVIGKVMMFTMGSTPAESLNAAGNIFIGQTEAPLLIRPFVPDLTESEIHSIMTGGFATVAGTVFAAYVGMGIDPTALLTASLMSAPASLAISKIVYPEVERAVTTGKVVVQGGKRATNFVEAISMGASDSLPLMANIAAMLIAFISLLAAANGLLSYIGGCVDYPELSFQIISGYVFYPFAILMGVAPEDAQTVGALLGEKTFTNEFVAYATLGELIKNREAGLEPSISERSELIATYALCGFANVGSMGIMLGGLTPLAPHRSTDFAKVVPWALVSGTIACFTTACVAGFLISD